MMCVILREPTSPHQREGERERTIERTKERTRERERDAIRSSRRREGGKGGQNKRAREGEKKRAREKKRKEAQERGGPARGTCAGRRQRCGARGGDGTQPARVCCPEVGPLCPKHPAHNRTRELAQR
eukprot:167695-Rhodomonas_salina.1